MRNLTDLRDVIDTLIKDGGNVATPAIIRRLRANHKKALETARTELEDLALTKLISDVGSRKNSKFIQGQGEFFVYYTGVPQTIVVKGMDQSGKVTFDRKPIHEATIGELRAWYEAHAGERKSPTGKFAGVEKLIEDAAEFAASADTKVGHALIARAEASK